MMQRFGDPVQIDGCSHKLRYLQTSIGNPALDALLGGALPNSSVTLIDEVRTRAYGDVLLRLFLSEGAHNGHDLFVAGEGTDKLLTSLPEKSASSASTSSSSAERNENMSTPQSDGSDMRIAWRYATLPQKNNMLTKEKSGYDLGRSLQKPTFKGSNVIQSPSCSYSEVLKELTELLTAQRYTKENSTGRKNLLRVVLRGVGGPLWDDGSSFLRFISDLRLLTRNSYAVIMCTTDSATFKERDRARLVSVSDALFRLEPFGEEEKKALPVLEKYHGYFHIVRLPRITSLTSFKPSAVDLVFELHRKSFDVKILHLPPMDAAMPTNGPACSKAVDF